MCGSFPAYLVNGIYSSYNLGSSIGNSLRSLLEGIYLFLNIIYLLHDISELTAYLLDGLSALLYLSGATFHSHYSMISVSLNGGYFALNLLRC